MDKRTQIPWQYVPILITLGLAGAVAALGPKDMKKQAEPDLVMKKDIDLGIILDTTSPIQLALPVTNQSSRLITIHDVAKDCSCTSVKIDKVKLAPGETATLRVVANLAGKTNLYEGNLIVESDAWEKVDQIHIHGQITGQIRIRPERVTLLMGDRAAPGSFSVFCDDQNGQWRYAGFVADDPDLAVQLHARETSLTTSVYDGTIDISSAAARKKYADFQTSLVTLTFVNDKLGRHFDLKYGVDIAVRRAVTVDPPQVMFLGNGGPSNGAPFSCSPPSRCASTPPAVPRPASRPSSTAWTATPRRSTSPISPRKRKRTTQKRRPVSY